jgi:hypothetical protein
MSLDQELLAAHEAKDSHKLAEIYGEHGFARLAENEDEGCFYLSFAYVFALEACHALLEKIETTLKTHKRL